VKGVGEVIICETGETLCDVYSSPAAGEEQADTDARLIAAAPDLLAACEAVAATTWSRNTATIIGEQVRAAIAKAKGETP
jgi:hypothetical protein